METMPFVTGVVLGLITAAYIILMGRITLGWNRLKNSVPRSGTKTGRKVSVIVAARNEEKNIVHLLDDLKAQDYGENFEIIVIDDHSEDNTAGIVDHYQGHDRLAHFILLRNEDFNCAGKKAAISNGIEMASGEIILLTDADCRLGKGWISGMTRYFDDEKVKMVFGPVKYSDEKGFGDRFQSLEFEGLVASGAGAHGAGFPFMCNGANLAYRKDAFKEVSGFKGNEKYLSGDDVFLMHRIKKAFGIDAIRFAMTRKALVRTPPARDLFSFLDQRVRWASKSKGYKDPAALFTALVVFLFNLAIIVAFVAGFRNAVCFLVFGGLILIKSMAELPLMIGVTRFTGHRKLLRWFLLFQLIYPFYIVIAGVGSLLRRKAW